MKSLLILTTILVDLLGMAATGAEPPSTAPARLRVMTYNIHHGEGMDKRLDLPRIAKIITDAKADLVALQEVDNKTKRTGGVDQAAELARLTGLHGVFGKAMDYSGGGYGEAVLSRWPIAEHKTHALPFTKGRESRAALEVRVQPPGMPTIAFVGTHLDHLKDDTDRLAQVKEINRLLARPDTPPAILAGDMNAEPDSAPMKSLLEHWADTAGPEVVLTCPADKPTTKIDWVLLLKKHGWRVISSQVIDEKVASDHRPVVVELEWVGRPNAPQK